jgi:hypothetical protein
MASISMSTFLQGGYVHALVQTHGIFPMAIRLRGDINSSAILHVDDNLYASVRRFVCIINR